MNYETVGTLVAAGGCNVCMHMACMCGEIHHVWKNNTICPWWRPPVSVHVYAICHCSCVHMWHYVHVTDKCVIHDEWDKSGKFITCLTHHTCQLMMPEWDLLHIVSVLQQLKELWKVYFRNSEMLFPLMAMYFLISGRQLIIKMFIANAEHTYSLGSWLQPNHSL